MRSDEMMAGALFDFIDRNLRKNLKQITNDQWVDIMEMSLEFIQLNHELDYRLNLKEFVKNRINSVLILK